LQAEFRATRRDKGKNVNYTFDNKINKKDLQHKRAYVQDFQFYSNKDVLLDLLQKEEDNRENNECEELTEEEIKLKDELLATGFKNWSRTDFNEFVTGCEKYGRKNYEEIARVVKKSVEEITKYSSVFWERIDELNEKDKILKQIQNGEDKIESRKLHA
jgi:SWI/SNF-related matrix-associated actin-dependent regulator of chromatin subfamily A member 5